MTNVIELHQTDYACPPWCVRTDHGADIVGPGFPPNHYAEDIGAVSPQSDGSTAEVIVHLGGHACFVSDAAVLREVAADMVRGAEWLEAHR